MFKPIVTEFLLSFLPLSKNVHPVFTFEKLPISKMAIGKKEEICIVDDFIIDGNNLNNPVMLLDTFDFGPREDNWFFYPGGNIGLYCPYSSKGAP